MRGFLGLAGAGLALVLALAGCGTGDGAGRLDATPGLRASSKTAPAAAERVTVPLAVQDVRVSVPRSLKVSEAEIYYPMADIVWRGDPRGNRYEQIEAIYAAAVAAATAPLTTGLPVVVDIEVTRFHGVTDKTRYSLGGLYSMKFLMTVRLAATGEVLSGPRLVDADLRAAGGQRAVAADYAGVTQKEIVTNRLAAVIRRNLASLEVDARLARVAMAAMASAAPE